MRKLIFAINITLDGCCDHDKGIADDETLEFFMELMRDIDLQIFGRKTYELMVPGWPDIAKNPAGESKATIDFAEAFVAIDKVVFSRTLEGVEGSKTRVVRAGLRDEILKLKQGQGKSMIVGGVDVSSQLIELGLVDEYYFVVHPVIAGEGRRLLEGASLPEKFQLKLVDTKIFRSGCVALHYVKQ